MKFYLNRPHPIAQNRYKTVSTSITRESRKNKNRFVLVEQYLTVNLHPALLHATRYKHLLYIAINVVS